MTIVRVYLQVFCIVVRETGSAEFDAIASDPETFYRINLKDYAALTDVTQEIVGDACLVGKINTIEGLL